MLPFFILENYHCNPTKSLWNNRPSGNTGNIYKKSNRAFCPRDDINRQGNIPDVTGSGSEPESIVFHGFYVGKPAQPVLGEHPVEVFRDYHLRPFHLSFNFSPGIAAESFELGVRKKDRCIVLDKYCWASGDIQK